MEPDVSAPQLDPLNCMGELAETYFNGVLAARMSLANERRAWAAERERLQQTIGAGGEEAQRRNAALEAARVENERLNGLVRDLMRENDALRAALPPNSVLPIFGDLPADDDDEDLPFGPSEAGRD